MPKYKAGRRGERGGQLCPTFFIRKAKVFSDLAPKQISVYASLEISPMPHWPEVGHMAASTCTGRWNSKKGLSCLVYADFDPPETVHCLCEPNQAFVGKAEGEGWLWIWCHHYQCVSHNGVPT